MLPPKVVKKMKHNRYPEEKIISILKGQEAGASVAWSGLALIYEIRENTIDRWESKFGGMEASMVERLKEFEAENKGIPP